MNDPGKKRKFRRRVKIVILLTLIGVVLFFCYQTTWITKFDLNSGRVFSAKSICGITVSSAVEETTFSEMLAAEGLTESPPRWVLVNHATENFCGLTRSHPAYHGILNQVRLIDNFLLQCDMQYQQTGDEAFLIQGEMKKRFLRWCMQSLEAYGVYAKRKEFQRLDDLFAPHQIRKFLDTFRDEGKPESVG